MICGAPICGTPICGVLAGGEVVEGEPDIACFDLVIEFASGQIVLEPAEGTLGVLEC